MNSKIKFIKNNNDMLYNPQKRIDTYYQLCQYKNPYTGFYGTRKIIFNEMGLIKKIFEREYNSKKINTFITHHKSNKFKLYPVNDIKYVDIPNGNDMTEAQSELLNNSYKEYDNLHINY